MPTNGSVILPKQGGGGGAAVPSAGAVTSNGTTLNSVAAGTSGNVLTDNGSGWVSQAPAAGGADTDLSNLSVVSINSSLLFQSGISIGSSPTTGPEYIFAVARTFAGLCHQPLVQQPEAAADGFIYVGMALASTVMIGSTTSGGPGPNNQIGWLNNVYGYVGLKDNSANAGYGQVVLGFGASSIPGTVSGNGFWWDLNVSRFTAVGGFQTGNAVAATIPGTIVNKMEIFDASGTSLGFIPIYDNIT